MREAASQPEPELPRYLQLLWGRESTGRRGPKPGRTIEEIGQAGVAVADRDGLDGVSMKSVAGELGMTPMSLYRYVDSKEQLLEVMIDSAYGPVPSSIMEATSWRARLTSWATALAEVLVRHPWASWVALSSPPLSPNVLSWTDIGAAALGDAKLTAQQKMSSLLVLDGYVRSHVRMSLAMGFIAPDPGDQDLYGRVLPRLIDAERFPALTAAAPAFADDPDDDFFRDELRFGLALVLDGIEAMIRRQRRSTSR